MIDIDYFKLYNDNYGHDAGDIALTRIATIIKDSLSRETDFVARYGGEEFVVLLPFSDSDGAYKIAENIRLNVKAWEIEHHFSEVDQIISISIGVSSLSGDDLNGADLFQYADKALYKAKKLGRNQSINY